MRAILSLIIALVVILLPMDTWAQAAVSTIAELQQLNPAQPDGYQVSVTGYYHAGDSPQRTYYLGHNGTGCTLNGGVGDGGSQIPTAYSMATACWLLPAQTVYDPRLWGAYGDMNKSTVSSVSTCRSISIATSGTYNATTGMVTLSFPITLGLMPGNTFSITGATGMGSDIGDVNGTFTATIGTGPSGANFNITYTIATGLNIMSIATAALVGSSVSGAPSLTFTNADLGKLIVVTNYIGGGAANLQSYAGLIAAVTSPTEVGVIPCATFPTSIAQNIFWGHDDSAALNATIAFIGTLRNNDALASLSQLNGGGQDYGACASPITINATLDLENIALSALCAANMPVTTDGLLETKGAAAAYTTGGDVDLYLDYLPVNGWWLAENGNTHWNRLRIFWWLGGNPSVPINSGTYNSTTGVVSLTLGSSLGFSPGSTFSVNGITGTGASANGAFTAGSGTSGTTLKYTIATGLTVVIPSNTGSVISVQAPQISAIAAASFTGSVTASTLTATPVAGVIRPGQTIYDVATPSSIPPGTRILSQLTSSSGGQSTYKLSWTCSSSCPAGDNMVAMGNTVNIAGVGIMSGSYAAGLVTLNLSSSLNLVPGSTFTVSGATGTGTNLARINGSFVAAGGTTGTTLKYTIASGLNITSITGATIINAAEGMITHGDTSTSGISDLTMIVGLNGTTAMLNTPPTMPLSSINVPFYNDPNGIVVAPNGGAQLSQLTIQQFGDASYIATPDDRSGCGIFFQGNQSQISQSYIDFGVAPICATGTSAGAVLTDNVSLFNSNYGGNVEVDSPAAVIMSGAGPVSMDRITASGQIQLYNMSNPSLELTVGHVSYVPSSSVPLAPQNIVALLTTLANTGPQRIYIDPFFDGLQTNNAVSFAVEGSGSWSCYTAAQLAAIPQLPNVLLANYGCNNWSIPGKALLTVPLAQAERPVTTLGSTNYTFTESDVNTEFVIDNPMAVTETLPNTLGYTPGQTWGVDITPTAAGTVTLTRATGARLYVSGNPVQVTSTVLSPRTRYHVECPQNSDGVSAICYVK